MRWLLLCALLFLWICELGLSQTTTNTKKTTHHSLTKNVSGKPRNQLTTKSVLRKNIQGTKSKLPKNLNTKKKLRTTTTSPRKAVSGNTRKSKIKKSRNGARNHGSRTTKTSKKRKTDKMNYTGFNGTGSYNNTFLPNMPISLSESLIRIPSGPDTTYNGSMWFPTSGFNGTGSYNNIFLSNMSFSKSGFYEESLKRNPSGPDTISNRSMWFPTTGFNGTGSYNNTFDSNMAISLPFPKSGFYDESLIRFPSGPATKYNRSMWFPPSLMSKTDYDGDITQDLLISLSDSGDSGIEIDYETTDVPLPIKTSTISYVSKSKRKMKDQEVQIP